MEQFARSFRTRFIEPGLISYKDIDGDVWYVSKDALDRMASSFRGCPVVNLTHKDLDPSTAYEGEADGIVTNAYWNDDGWYWCDFLVWDEDTIRNIEAGYGVSCAYDITSAGNGGEYHGLPYDRRVLEGKYLHLAIVDNPRYAGGEILENAKPDNRVKEIKVALFKTRKNEAPPEETIEKEEKKEEEIFNADEAYVEIDGEEISLDALMDVYRKGRENEDPEETKQVLKEEDEVDIDGEKVRVSELIERYRSQGAAVENGGCDPETKVENSEPPKKTVNPQLKNAAHEAEGFTTGVKTRTDRLAEGKARYGRSVEGGTN